MIEKKIKSAVIGCGRVSRTAHYDALKKLEDFNFVAVCDIDKERADHWSRENNVKAYYDYETMLEQEELDLVSINVPNGYHPTFAMKAVQKGIHVLSEKPLGMDLAQVDELIDCVEQSNTRLYTVLQNRFNDTNQLLKKCVERNRFGRIHTCNVTMRWHRGLNYYMEDQKWRSRKDLAGGAFTNQAVHYIDTMLWLCGAPVETVYAKMGTCTHPIDVETHGSAIISFKNGIIGSLNLSNLTYPDDREGSITIMGEKGTVKVGGKSMNQILEWDFAEKDNELDKAALDANYEPPTVYGFGHEEMYRRIGLQLAHNDLSIEIPDGRDGRKSVEILQALYTSDKLNEVIRLPLGKR